MTINQRLINDGIPEHIVADGIFYTWLFMAGRNRERVIKRKIFKQRFQLSGLSEHGKDLTECVQLKEDSALKWASENLKEFLPPELKDQYLSHYISFCFASDTLLRSEYYILRYISDLFEIDSDELHRKLKRQGGFKTSDLTSEDLIRKENLSNTELSREQVKDSVEKLRSMFVLGKQEFHDLKPKTSSEKFEEKPLKQVSATSKTDSSDSRPQNNTTTVSEAKVSKKPLISISVVVVVAIIIGIVISNMSKQFQADLRAQEQELLAEFDNKHTTVAVSLRLNEREVFQRFADRFNKDEAYVTDYETFLGAKYEYTYPSTQYLSCLESDARAELQSSDNRELSAEMYDNYRSRFGSSFEDFMDKLDEEGYNVTKETVMNCENFFGERDYYVFNKGYWDDIERVMLTNSKENGEALAKSQIAEREFEADLRRARSQLIASYQSIFDNQIRRNRSSILTETEGEVETVTDNFGTWVTKTSHLTYNDDVLDRLLDQALNSQWETNSIQTGSAPYANCYGSTDSCSGWGCSQIEVTAGSSDVIVTIKNSSNRVVRHAYIRSRQKYTFDISNGTYNIYFYSGRGWNPNKVQSSSSCSNLRGGFVSNESFTKDHESNRLNNNILFYELREMTSGNFRPGSSSAAEAF